MVDMNRKMQIIIMAAGIVLFAAGFCSLKIFGQLEGALRALPYLGIGIGCGMFGHSLGEILSRKAREKDPEMARKIDIEAKDERNIMLANASKAKGFEMMTYVFGAIMLAYVLMGASLEIILTFVAAYLFVQIYTIYHRVKMDKEK